ncbi:putative MFS family arabinose efflux permease [Sphingobium xanthum]|uniref:MFS transporter n=1 Tax=Sphingobium xanthum TaxID=1387165 RepID=UPI001C8B22A0|nr:MFS transporter [Sphingobium xanthum]
MPREHRVGYELRVVLLLGLAYGFAFYDRMTMAFLSPFVVEDLKLNNTQVGALGSGLSLTWALGAYFIGRWSDKTGKRKPFLLGALLIFSLSSILSGLSTDFWTLLASRVIMGAAEGPFLPICLAIIAAASAPQRRGLNSGIVQNGFGSLLGNALAPLLVVAIAVQWGWRTSFFTAGLPGLILLFIIWRFIDEPPATPADQQPAATGAKSSDGFVAMLRHSNILICAIISCLAVGSIVLGSIFLPLFLTQVRGYSPTTMSTIMAILGICPVVGGVLVTWISDRIGRRTPMIVFSLLMTLCPLAALLVKDSVVLMTSLMFIGWIGIGIFPLFMGVIPAETLSFRNTAAAMGIVVAIGEIFGGVAAPVMAGWIADQSSLFLPLAIQAGMSFAGGLAAFLLRETNPAVLAQREAVAA